MNCKFFLIVSPVTPKRSRWVRLEVRSTLWQHSTIGEAVERAFDSQPWLLHHVGVNLRRSHVHVPEQILQCADVGSGLQQMRRQGVA